jgi:ATP/maltotriose-dependent transcriptional regulator MalT
LIKGQPVPHNHPSYFDDLAEQLTDRERRILICLVRGLTNQEIAEQLHLALATVKWYNTQIYGKLGVSNRDEAIHRAKALGVVTDEALTTVPHNLPAQTTPFVGRVRELRQLAQLLTDSETRLVTIFAAGGMGKTRLSLATAEHLLRHFTDGVYFVPLVHLNSPEDIVTTIAEYVGFSFYAHR